MGKCTVLPIRGIYPARYCAPYIVLANHSTMSYVMYISIRAGAEAYGESSKLYGEMGDVCFDTHYILHQHTGLCIHIHQAEENALVLDYDSLDSLSLNVFIIMLKFHISNN